MYQTNKYLQSLDRCDVNIDSNDDIHDDISFNNDTDFHILSSLILCFLFLLLYYIQMAELANIARTHVTFTDAGSSNVSGVAPGIKSTPRDFCRKVKDDMYMLPVTKPASVSLLDSDCVFTIPKSDQYVNDFMLEVTGTGASVYDMGEYGGANIIKKISFAQGSDTIMEYSGKDLIAMMTLINRNNSDVMGEVNYITRPAADPDVKTMTIPLLAPGSKCLFNNDPTNNDIVAWPVGLCSTDLIITLTTNTGAYMSKTNAFELSSLKITYNKYVDKSTVKNIFNENKGGNRVQIWWSTLYIRTIAHALTTASITQNVEYTLTGTDGLFIEGEVDGGLIWVTSDTNASTEKEYFKGEELTSLKWQIGEIRLYEHNSTTQGRAKCLQKYKCVNKFNGTNGGYFYPMSICTHNDNSIISGNLTASCNFINNKPTVLFTTAAATGTYTVHFIAIYKCFYSILAGGDGFKQMIPAPKLM